jgi:hypothetical protein
MCNKIAIFNENRFFAIFGSRECQPLAYDRSSCSVPVTFPYSPTDNLSLQVLLTLRVDPCAVRTVARKGEDVGPVVILAQQPHFNAPPRFIRPKFCETLSACYPCKSSDFGGSYELPSTIRAVNPTEELRYGSRIKYVPTRVAPFDNDHSKAP